MSRPHVAILDDWDQVSASSPAMAELRGLADVRVFNRPLSPDSLPEAVRGCLAVIPIRERSRFDARLLGQLPDLRHIAQTGHGTAHIDLAAARALGIQVSITPGGSAQAVAELTLGLLLAVVHRIGEGDRALRRGEWPRLIGGEIAGKTLGLIGLGTIGQEVAIRARAFGMKLLAWSPNMTQERARLQGAQAVSLAELLAHSDAASIHLRLLPETQGLLSYERLKGAKPGLILINTARGPIAPGPDLVRALVEGLLGGAGLDVFDEEPLPAGHPITQVPNVVLTPHVGWTTRETYERFLQGAVDNLRAYITGAPTNLVDGEHH